MYISNCDENLVFFCLSVSILVRWFQLSRLYSIQPCSKQFVILKSKQQFCRGHWKVTTTVFSQQQLQKHHQQQRQQQHHQQQQQQQQQQKQQQHYMKQMSEVNGFQRLVFVCLVVIGQRQKRWLGFKEGSGDHRVCIAHCARGRQRRWWGSQRFRKEGESHRRSKQRVSERKMRGSEGDGEGVRWCVWPHRGLERYPEEG